MTNRDYVDSLSINIGTARSWRKAGLSSAQLRALTASGELVRVRRGVYASARFVAAAREDPALRHVLRVVAAVNAQATRDAVASHQSAAGIYGISLLTEPDPNVVWLTRPPGRYRGGQVEGVRFHAARLPPDQVGTVLGALVTSPARTVVDLARSLPFLEGVAAADSALHLGITTKPQLRHVLGGCAHWPGAARARQVVDFSDGLSESVLESAARVVFAQAGLPTPQLQVEIRDEGGQFVGRADFYWPEHRTIVEVDGMAKYSDPERAQAQIRRDIRLREAGYKVVHVTWADLFGRPAKVIDRIRRAFAATTPY